MASDRRRSSHGTQATRTPSRAGTRWGEKALCRRRQRYSAELESAAGTQASRFSTIQPAIPTPTPVPAQPLNPVQPTPTTSPTPSTPSQPVTRERIVPPSGPDREALLTIPPTYS